MPEPVTSGVLIELGPRRRVDLGSVGRHDRYLAREETDGTIVLTPAVVMRVSELEKLVGPQKAKKVGPKKAVVSEPVPDPADAGAASLSAVAQNIIDVVRKAGGAGIAAGDIVNSVDASRSRIYNELAMLRNTGKVSNFTGKYILGG